MPWLTLALIMAVGLGLRLLVWQWREFYPLGGDETEYFNQALTLLRERRYEELILMRPPLYTIFLATAIWLYDSQVQYLRLLQALLSTLTILPIYALSYELFGKQRVALLAALLTALSYTLAFHATELLSETLWLFGMSLAGWLLVRAVGRPSLRSSVWHAALAGLVIGLLALVRSVALPLVALGVLWLLITKPSWLTQPHPTGYPYRWPMLLALVLTTILVVAPWTIRNYVTYGALIVVDTTGAENLWLDNNPQAATPADPLGREAAKRELIALGNDRAARQQLATANGTAAITGNPEWFTNKALGELRTFFALQFADDLHERPEIWVPPAEVALRLLLGDTLWLIILLAGVAGWWLVLGSSTPLSQRWALIAGLWSLYVLFTTLLFHVELRYRLPLFPMLLPFAAWVLTISERGAEQIRIGGRILALLSVVACVSAMLWHRPYHSEALRLVGKHNALWQAEQALSRGDALGATTAATNALNADPRSALARIALARAALQRNDRTAAQRELDAALAQLPDHPQARVLRGLVLRSAGQREAAQRDLIYEHATLQDLQQWSWEHATAVAPPLASQPIGGGADLGNLRGFQRPLAFGELEPFRWSGAEAEVRLAVPSGANTLVIELNGGRPTNAPAAMVSLLANGQVLDSFMVSNQWQTYQVPLRAEPGMIIVTVRSSTFRPRDYDRTSPDGRTLGVQLRQIEIRP
jgi:4-amino-4-deoxy-L-arabinose transferase-like glycosyltransferase